ncbi:islet cell auto antigen 1 [Mytilus galloprovincialis]|uniref:Islet cell auto antigen 1 n=2 Tax=Mytilus galloprovincialis TaxID=29158 RepID=A0A8B6CH83_MYTGA|nr:islet cell auto antigen 1 [Mytilus galloprovincialis]VDI04581.1 islet cell auto antigen 1 [Mytilus galloprovincialis]
MSRHGYSGSNYDKYVERTDTSTVHKIKETFWTTKQAVIQKLGKKEDEHVVASDAQLDAKLEVFRSIQRSSMELLKVIEKYQDRLCRLSQEESSTGRFLKSQSNIDKTRAGKMMAAVGKSQSFSAQQRLAMRVPLVRLYQEVETFRYRAISDTLMTINRMEGARTEYRGALLWMKDVSEQLDPDTYKQLEKFRKVQAQVRKTKAKFDKLKLDVMQKVDLLAASRCNMFSHVLANYQSTLLHFWEKTSRTMTAVAESFKGYQYYEFNIIKDLAEPSRKLAEETGKDKEADIDDDFDPSNYDYIKEKCQKQREEFDQELSSRLEGHIDENDDQNLLQNNGDISENISDDRLIEFEDYHDDEGKDSLQTNGSLQNLYEGDGHTLNDENKSILSRDSKKSDTSSPFIEFEEDKPEEDFSGQIISTSEKMKLTKVNKKDKDLLSDDLDPDDTDKDDMTILNEILNAPSTEEDEFSAEWQAVFGDGRTATTMATNQGSETEQHAEFMPSNLLDLNKEMSGINLSQGEPQQGNKMVSGQNLQQPKAKSQKKKGQDMSAWFNLFADLDPLSNPDAIGKTEEDMSNAQF